MSERVRKAVKIVKSGKSTIKYTDAHTHARRHGKRSMYMNIYMLKCSSKFVVVVFERGGRGWIGDGMRLMTDIE